ncbi:MAG: MoaD/ThiS family protein [Proteobacteria bacterium]|nr:MoaD/ThiS family protein [Pseudomonadota bacterium]MBU1741000.1 MoaD/ThiS family protein [Pseudomonadota bacterium]
MVLPGGEVFHHDRGASLIKVLKKLDLDPQTVLVARGDELLTLDAQIEADDEIRIIPVMSGG